MATSILSDAPTGRLYKELVETGLATQVFGWTIPGAQPGFVVLGAQVKKGEDLGPVRAKMVDVIENSFARTPVTDQELERQKAEQATPDDIQTATDLLETLEAHKDGCVGMAANMIGVNKRIIAFDNQGAYMVMFNPEIVKRAGPYEVEEGCLSLSGTRRARRWESIKVRWQNEKFQERVKTFTGWTAQIIQHEIDHCEGIII